MKGLEGIEEIYWSGPRAGNYSYLGKLEKLRVLLTPEQGMLKEDLIRVFKVMMGLNKVNEEIFPLGWESVFRNMSTS